MGHFLHCLRLSAIFRDALAFCGFCSERVASAALFDLSIGAAGAATQQGRTRQPGAKNALRVFIFHYCLKVGIRMLVRKW